MALCFIEPQDAIRVIAESVGREARRQLLGELVRAWVDEIPDERAASRTTSRRSPTSTSTTCRCSPPGTPRSRSASRSPTASSSSTSSRSLGDNRREALKIAAGFRGEEAFDDGVAEEQALETVLPYLSRERVGASSRKSASSLYLWDRLGCDN